jgi:ATP adenylyltransferase/5',5'''-P-1,P-4-tetraphosphate phosphorylase II
MARVSDLEVAKKLISIASSAKDREIDFDMSFKKVKQLLERETCYYTGVKFEEEGEFKRSFDRVLNDKGYVDDNVVVCTVQFNGKKKDLSVHDITTMYRGISKFLTK